MQNNNRPGPPPESRPQRRAPDPGQDRREPALRRTEPRQPDPPRQKGNRWFRAIMMVIATLAGCFFLAYFILQSASDLLGLNQIDRQIEVTIPSNPTLQKVSSILYDEGIVSQPFTFRVYAGLKAEDEDLKPGDYIFNANMGYDQIIVALKTGNTKKEVVMITFIEGSTLYEMALKLEENKVCSADEFLDYMDTANDIDYEFMNQVPRSALRYHRLEGYAFPDTYEFYIGMEVAKVADKFLDNFNKRITEDMRAKMREMNLSLDETVILASIIQKEAGDPVEMSMVSSVFQNRLALKEVYPNLQSDVTIHYVDNFIKPFLDWQDQPMYDAYNTYKCEGMPVGAICNPGLAAFEAVLDPDNSSYYFFVTDSEGTYYYAETANAHYANVVKAAKVGEGKIHGTDTVSE